MKPLLFITLGQKGVRVLYMPKSLLALEKVQRVEKLVCIKTFLV